MRQPRIVPWIDAQEWSQIYHELYGSHELQQHAVMRIKAWLSRGRVPVAIESTSNLVEISLSDHSPTEKRLLLSMALIRFVNGIVDQGQRGGFAASALVVAHDLGLPSWLVELRHQATHDKLPSLVLLESARVHALDWLHQNYWQVQENAEQTLKQSLNELLLQYNDARAHAAFSDKPDVNTNDVLDRLKMAVTLDTCHLLVKILVDELDTQCGSELGTANLSTWEPLLTCCECTWPEFSVMLTNKLIEKLQNNAADTVGAESAAAWVRHISVKYLSPMAKYVAGPMCQRLLLHPHHT